MSEDEKAVKAEKATVARFWSKSRMQALDAPIGSKRKDIRIDEWVYEGGEKTREAAWLRSQAVQDRFQVFEIYQKPYETPVKIAQFILWLQKLMFTGMDRSEGASPEGRNSIMAMLTEEQKQALPKEVRNSAGKLAATVAGMISLSMEEFDVGDET